MVTVKLREKKKPLSERALDFSGKLDVVGQDFLSQAKAQWQLVKINFILLAIMLCIMLLPIVIFMAYEWLFGK